MNAPSPHLKGQELSFYRDYVPVFENLSFELSAGQLLVLQGDNGSGKTTLLRLIAGILEAESGHFQVDNKPVGRERLSNLLPLSFLGHKTGFKDDLSVVENLAFHELIHEARNELDSTHAIDKVGLSGYEDQLGRHLSAGQRKRLSLAMLSRTRSILWLMDEPYSNLDKSGARLVDNLLEPHLASGGMCILSSHGLLMPQTCEYELLSLDGASA